MKQPLLDPYKAVLHLNYNKPMRKFLALILIALAGVFPSMAKEPLKYHYNFCTHSYSMPFWGQQEWDDEIDLMIERGINMPLIITGMECVWKALLEKYNYPEPEKFIPGPAYMAWFQMNNLTGWGGPLPQSWFDEHLELARHIFARCKEAGIQPVIPGYNGMIPHDFLEKTNVGWDASDVNDSGTWCGFQRPAFVTDYARLEEFGDAYYQVVDSLFGDVLESPYFAVDPFHEGGKIPDGLDCSKSVQSMWASMLRHNPDAVWVAQHWQDNPKEFLTHSIPSGRLIILDLHADSQGHTECGGHHTDKFGQPHEWIYCVLNNYGDNVGIFGRAPLIADSYLHADRDALVGSGAIPEGISTTPMIYDLAFSLPSLSENYGLDEWLADWVLRRYGLASDTEEAGKAMEAWKNLAHTIYNSPYSNMQGTAESVFMQRPADEPKSVSSWAHPRWYWNMDTVVEATTALLSLAPELKDNADYVYDVVDLTRQCLADKGKILLDSYSRADSIERKELAAQFLDMILAQDRLLGSHPRFRLGTWIEQARERGVTEEEKDLMEWNARMLLTTWGAERQCNRGGLHDYANREWNGLLRHYYYPRWQRYFESGECDWFNELEWPFVKGETVAYGTFSSNPEGNPIELANEVMNTYILKR